VSKNDRLIDLVERFQRIVNLIKSLGLIGGIVCLGVGPAWAVVEIKIWKLSPENSFEQLVEACDKGRLLGAFIVFLLGVAVLFWQSNFWMLYRIKGINKAQKKYGLDVKVSSLAKTQVLLETRGGSTQAINECFDQFVQWSQDNKRIKPENLETIRKAWNEFRGIRSQEG